MAVMCGPLQARPSPAVFLDKDGTLLEDVPYNVDPARIALAPGAGDGLRLLAATGLPLIVVSNQPGVALGYFPEHALDGVAQRLGELFALHGATLGGFYFCPHAPAADGSLHCACRKPGEFQTYDIIFPGPRFEGSEVKTPAYATVLHNGVVVQNHVKLVGATGHTKRPAYVPHGEKGPLKFPDHGNPVKFRNIWLRELKPVDSQ
jgi:histidinol-phosphate phosphatase family protein